MQRILMNITGIKVRVESEWKELLMVLEKDFWSFREINFEESLACHLTVRIHRTDARPPIPEVSTSMQSQNSLSYDQGPVRFNDYYAKAYTVINFKTETADIYGTDHDKVHEIAYLLILSRAGKMLDLMGLHKLHAFAISFNDTAFVCMMPSKGGKSTLLSELLSDPRVKMLSDDIPLVDSHGQIHSFALKLGFNEIPAHLEILNPEENLYSMKRDLFGEKKLICTRGIESKVETRATFDKVILAEGFRYNSENSIVVKSSWLQTFKGLFKHGVIGIGSPIVIEYFWETGMTDFLRKTKIFFKRLKAFLSLSLRAQKFQIHIGKDQRVAARAVIELLEKETNIKETL